MDVLLKTNNFRCFVDEVVIIFNSKEKHAEQVEEVPKFLKKGGSCVKIRN